MPEASRETFMLSIQMVIKIIECWIGFGQGYINTEEIDVRSDDQQF